MEDLVSREEIETKTGVGHSQFRSFRRYGLIDGHVRKKSIVKLDESKTRKLGKKSYQPAGFEYLYPRSILNQISWVQKQREQGKNLAEIQKLYVRNQLEAREKSKNSLRQYGMRIPVSLGASEGSAVAGTQVRNAVTKLTESIRRECTDREIKTLVFIVKPERPKGQLRLDTGWHIELDVESSYIE